MPAVRVFTPVGLRPVCVELTPSGLALAPLWLGSSKQQPQPAEAVASAVAVDEVRMQDARLEQPRSDVDPAHEDGPA